MSTSTNSSSESSTYFCSSEASTKGEICSRTPGLGMFPASLRSECSSFCLEWIRLSLFWQLCTNVLIACIEELSIASFDVQTCGEILSCSLIKFEHNSSDIKDLPWTKGMRARSSFIFTSSVKKRAAETPTIKLRNISTGIEEASESFSVCDLLCCNLSKR